MHEEDSMNGQIQAKYKEDIIKWLNVKLCSQY